MLDSKMLNVSGDMGWKKTWKKIHKSRKNTFPAKRQSGIFHTLPRALDLQKSIGSTENMHDQLLKRYGETDTGFLGWGSL